MCKTVQRKYDLGLAAVANEEQGSTEPEPLVSSSNPFLLMAETKGNEGTEDSVSSFLYYAFDTNQV